MKTFKTKTGQPFKVQSVRDLNKAAWRGNLGFCTNCGEIATGIEPDGHRIRCIHCERPRVYGAEQLLALGLFYSESEEAAA